MKLNARSALFAALGTALLVSGCSGSDSGSGAATPTEESTATAPQATGDIKTGRDPNAPFTVAATDLGIHSYTTAPEVPTKAIRLTCSPNWATANPSEGKFKWTEFDAELSRAESWGFSEILYSFCATPKWAGKPVKGDDKAAFGPGTAQPPKNMDVWRDWVTAVAKRYKGRIKGYEVWNEPSSEQFYAGTVDEMVEMSEVAYDAIKKADPDAYVLSASSQTHKPEYVDDFLVPYIDGLSKADWPIDGMAAHFYPAGNGTPQTRVEAIEMVQDELAKAEAPEDLPLWDTEVNYSVGQPGGEPEGRITGQRAAAWTAVTFLDSWRTGVRRPYWYLWSADYYSFPGIQMRVGDASTAALNTLGEWIIDAEFQGCDDKQSAIECKFDKDGTFTIAYSTGGDAELALPAEAEVCPVYGAECQQRSGTLAINDTPVRIKTSAS